MQHTLSIEYGDELLFNLSMSPEQFSEEAKLLLAAKFYELGKLTAGQAARFCGRGRVDFLLALSRLGVPAANLRPEDAALESSSAAMAELMIINTGPLVALARADALVVISQLPITLVCPREVKEELEDGNVRGHMYVDPPRLRVLDLETPLHPVAGAALDRGEAAVIQLALEQGLRWVCIDDWKGRRAAMAVGLQVTGSLGLLIRAKSLGIIQTILPYIKRATGDGIWYDPELVKRVLEGVNE